ncbi:hypothetical protein B0H11DRAFT_1995900 [Mycena galericulata]|nr:hypothetical protein B0H11DRAFT_1995900 [Mycena galericulata]
MCCSSPYPRTVTNYLSDYVLVALLTSICVRLCWHICCRCPVRSGSLPKCPNPEPDLRTAHLDDCVGTDIHTSHSIISDLSDHPSTPPQQSYLTVKCIAAHCAHKRLWSNRTPVTLQQQCTTNTHARRYCFEERKGSARCSDKDGLATTSQSGKPSHAEDSFTDATVKATNSHNQDNKDSFSHLIRINRDRHVNRTIHSDNYGCLPYRPVKASSGPFTVTVYGMGFYNGAQRGLR